MRVLIVEDNRDVADFLKAGLEEEMFVVDVAYDGEQGSLLAREGNYDLVILDLMLPSKSGRVVCEEIRAAGKPTPIIVLSVRSEIPDKVSLFNSGADDYLIKPFAFGELLARIQAVMRRPRGLASDLLTVGDVVLDLTAHTVVRKGNEVVLTGKEFAILECLMRNAGKVVGRTHLADTVWGRDDAYLSRTLETHILNLRKKLSKKDKRRLIVTITGRGYKMVV